MSNKIRVALLLAGIAVTPILAMALPVMSPSSDYAVAWAPGPEGEPWTFDCELGGDEDCPE